MLSIHRKTAEEAHLIIEEAIKEKNESLVLISYKALGQLPSVVYSMTYLTRLCMQQAKITTLPTQIGCLTKLKDLDFALNEISSLPTEIGLLTNLTDFDFSHNCLTSIPTEIGVLTKLDRVHLQSNEITSCPTQIGLLTNITRFDICMNKLTELPNELWELTNLTLLSLNSNNLDSLSPLIGRLKKLDTLYLFSNKLTALPTTIGELEQLKQLYLGLNQLSFLPHELGRLKELTKLDLEKNRNLSELPMNLGEMPKLLEIQIKDTGISNAMRAIILSHCKESRKELVHELPSRLKKWMAYAEIDPPFDPELPLDQKLTLNEWLLRLERTNDFKSAQKSLAKIVCAMMKDFKHPDFNTFFFNQAEANNTHCEDRAAMSLNEAYTSWLLLCKSPDLPREKKLKLFAGVAKTLRLRKALQAQIANQEILRKKGNSHYEGESESVEIYLYYETALRVELQLETAIQNMAHDEIGFRRWIDIKELIKDVKENFYEELIDIPLFAKMMEKEFKAIELDYRNNFLLLGECPKGGDHDLPVLNYHVKVGELINTCKKEKIKAAKRLYPQ